jgi:predicted dehydrogenase
LIHLLGPIASVVASGTTPRAERADRAGRRITVRVPTTIAGALAFASGALISLSLSWDVVANDRPPLVLHGETGTLIAPDPNMFDGPTSITRDGATWETIGTSARRARHDAVALAKGVAALMAGTDPTTGQPVDPQTSLRLGDRRGLGVVDLADAIRTGRPPRADGRLAYHALEVLLGLERSIRTGERIDVRSDVGGPTA